FDAISSGKAKGLDPILVDTAGRLHTRVNLMNELEQIRRIASREVPGAPQEVLLVLDATVGQNGVTQAREFMGAAGVNGIVLTKLDGTAKGGVAVAIAHDLKLPIRYVGVGETIDDLVPFDAEESLARGATLYCTLEPCCHTGRTGPCTERIVGAGIARVVAAIGDPNPVVNGRGFAFLRGRGVDVEVGLGAAAAARLNQP